MPGPFLRGLGAAVAIAAAFVAFFPIDRPSAQSYRIREQALRAHVGMLASDALRGRASGSRDEWVAAAYVESQLRLAGIEPAAPDGAFIQPIDLASSPAGRGASGMTWNVIGRIPGADPARAHEVILLGAHLDHVGERGEGPDTIYNGADDDASGVAAVLELARAIGAGWKRPGRTILFAFFGSEERGGVGSGHFAAQPPVPLSNIVAHVQFEMIGRPDPGIAPAIAWLTGFERSTLGDALVGRGAPIAADPYPDRGFFFGSDNIRLAYHGVVAHTISSYALHDDYHRPSDDVAGIDFAHMTRLVGAMIEPIEWLADSAFVPAWREGLSPERRPSEAAARPARP